MLEMLIGRCPTAGRVEDVCKCPKPTHFNYNHDQLVKTFRLVGTPPNGTFLSKMHCLCHFEGWPKYTSRLVEVVTNALLSDRAHATREAPSQNVVEPLLDDSSESLNVVSDWIQVLSMMLTCDPDNRPHAFQVLESPFWHSSVPIAADPGLASIEEMGSRRFSSPGGINTKSYREQTGILKEQGILGSLARSRSDMRSDVNKISPQLLPVRAGTGSHRTKGRRGEVLGSDASASNSPRPEGWGGEGGAKGKGCSVANAPRLIRRSLRFCGRPRCMRPSCPTPIAPLPLLPILPLHTLHTLPPRTTRTVELARQWMSRYHTRQVWRDHQAHLGAVSRVGAILRAPTTCWAGKLVTTRRHCVCSTVMQASTKRSCRPCSGATASATI